MRRYAYSLPGFADIASLRGDLQAIAAHCDKGYCDKGESILSTYSLASHFEDYILGLGLRRRYSYKGKCFSF